MELIFGTGNQAKLRAMRRRLEGLPIEVIGLEEARKYADQTAFLSLKEIEEDGKTPLQNAVKKARAYYGVFQRPVFSCDSGLYFENDRFPEELQPGVHVRTIKGRYCTDEEVAAYYTGLAEIYGDLKARYRHAICLILGEGREYSSMGEELASRLFLITPTPHERPFNPGFPLDRYSKDPETGKYFYDLGDEETVDKLMAEDGMVEFFRRVLEGD